jgi:hypothetical protein
VKLLVVWRRHVDEIDGVKEDLLKARSFASLVARVLYTSGKWSGVPPLGRRWVNLNGVNTEFNGGMNRVFKATGGGNVSSKISLHTFFSEGTLKAISSNAL